jgi:uncharacterized protein
LPSQIELLIELQQVDLSLRENTQAVSAGEERVAELVDAHRTKTIATEQARAAAAVLGTRQRDLEGRLAAAEAKMKDRRMRLTRIRNDKELGLAKREVDLLKEEITAIETELQQVYEQAEAATTTLGALETELTAIGAERDSEETALRETTARLAADIERDRSRREALIAKLDGEVRRRYEMILARRGGVAVVAVREGTCQGCRMRVPPQLYNQIQRNDQVILCPSCQRMLHWQPLQEEASE